MPGPFSEQLAASLPCFPAGRVRSTHLLAGSVLIGALCLGIAQATTGYMAFATMNYSLLVSGLLLRKFRRWHIAAMSLGIAGDLLLVLLLELQRDAINTAVSMTLSPLQLAHVAASSLATTLYIPTLFFGILRVTKRVGEAGRTRHLTFGLSAFLFRTLGFIFMFSLLTRKVLGV